MKHGGHRTQRCIGTRRWRRGIRLFAVALALLFAGVQVHALAHGAAYGTDAHEHNGSACHVQAAAKGLAGIPTAQPDITEPGFGAADRPAYRRFQIRRADLRERKPIRAPPRTHS